MSSPTTIKPATSSPQAKPWVASAALAARTRKRHRAEWRMKFYGIAAISLALLFLLVLMISVVAQGWGAFLQTQVTLDVTLSERAITPSGERTPEAIYAGKYGKVLRESVFATFPDVLERRDRRALLKLVSTNARFEIRDYVLNHPEEIGTTVRLKLTAGPDVEIGRASCRERV